MGMGIFCLKIFGNGLLIRTQKYEADQLRMEIGHYLDNSNSLHIYGNTISELKDMLEQIEIRVAGC